MHHPTTYSSPDELWKEMLTPEQFHVLREHGTEMPGSGLLLYEKREGVYYCAACDQLLFHSDAKFDAGTGWPSFSAPMYPENIELRHDDLHGSMRTEVRCSNCKGHLGHLYSDGPPPTGFRYCINSVAMGFEPEFRWVS